MNKDTPNRPLIPMKHYNMLLNLGKGRFTENNEITESQCNQEKNRFIESDMLI